MVTHVRVATSISRSASAPKSDATEIEQENTHEPDASELEDNRLEDEMMDQVSAEPDINEPEIDETESRYTESEHPAPGMDINRALQNKLEEDFGKLPPNIIIGGIPKPNSGYGNGANGGFGR